MVTNWLDSIFTSNDETRPFYFLTITRTTSQADGAYAEPLGMMGKQFVETRPMDFINYFQHETLLTPTDFDEWAKTVAGEIEISFSEQEKQEVEKLLTKMKSNCVNCNDVQGKWIGDFIDKVATNVAMVYPEE